MNSKKNSFKRVAAGALAVLTVAAYTAPVANVGGLPSVNSIVAEAATKSTFTFNQTGLNKLITYVSDGSVDYEAANIIDNDLDDIKLTAGAPAIIKSKTPLTFEFDNANGKTVQVKDGIYGVETVKTKAITSSKVNNGYIVKNVTDDEYIEAGTQNFTEIAGKEYKYYRITFTKSEDSFSSSGSTTGGYTYKFVVPEFGFTAKAKTTAINLQNDATNGIDLTFLNGTTKKTKIKGLQTAPTVVNTSQGNATTALQNEDITLIAEDYFKVYVYSGDPATGFQNYSANFDSTQAGTNPTSGKYYVTFKAPIHDDAFHNAGDLKTNIIVEAANPTFSYASAESGTKLKATGSGVDTVVASATGTVIVPDKNGKYTEPAEGKETVLASNASAQKNKSLVTVNLDKAQKFLRQSSDNDYAGIKITLNGKELADDDNDTIITDYTIDAQGALTADTYSTYADLKTNIAGNAGDVTQVLNFNKAGNYVITYTVYVPSGTSVVPKTVTYKFSIATLDKFTANNVKLTFNDAAYDTQADADAVKDLLVSDANGPVCKLVNGVYTFEVKEGKKLGGKTVHVTAELYTSTKKTAGTEYGVAGADYDVSGSLMVNSINKTQTVNISYDDREYSTKEETIAVKWKVVEAAKTILVVDAEKFNALDEEQQAAFDVTTDVTSIGANYKPTLVETSIDEISTLEDKIKKSIYVINGDIDNVSFEYVAGKNAIVDKAELDTHIAGLPNKVGDYSVFILYNGEAKNTIDVNVSEHGLYAAPKASQLKLTYGTALFTEKNISYVDYTGKTVSKPGVSNIDLKVYTVTKLTKAEINAIDEDGLLNKKPVYTIDGVKYKQGPEFKFSADKKSVDDTNNSDDTYSEGELLPAGNYIVVVKSKENNATKVEKEGYSLLSRDFVVTVAKKKITSDMVLIDPAVYNDGRAVDMGTIHGSDAKAEINNAAYDIQLKLADGISSGKKVGAYAANITVDEEELNYEGTVAVEWYIVKEADNENLAGFDWNDDVTTIYDNGKIHCEFSRPATNTFDSEIKEYGVLVEKNGKIAAPVFAGLDDYVNKKSPNGFYAYDENNMDESVAAAYTALQYGNGMVASGQQSATQAKKDDGQLCGINVSVVSANIGAWARPYIVLKDGTIYYGEVRYLNLNYEATDKLNLSITQEGEVGQVKQTAVTRETIKKDLDAEELKDKIAWRKGVKSGYNELTGKYYVYAAYSLDENTNVKPNAVQAFGFVADKAGKIKDAADAAETLLIGKGFTEGRASKTSTKMDFDEIGANITPKDSVTGVWVRSFVDFGNGLVVYTDPVYLKSVSEQYDTFEPAIEITTVDGKNVYEATLNANTPIDENGTVDVKSVGVVIDNNGRFFKYDSTNDKYVTVEGVDPNATLISQNATNMKFVSVGKTPLSVAPEFTGKLTPNKDSKDRIIPVVARAYVVYSINGVDVTVYGTPYVYTGNNVNISEWEDVYAVDHPVV